MCGKTAETRCSSATVTEPLTSPLAEQTGNVKGERNPQPS
jgi:hypothetical protein